MSVFDKEISKVGFSSVGNGWDDDGDDEHGGVHSYRKKKIGGRFSRNLGKSKKVVVRPFTRSKKQIEIPTKIQTRDSSSTLSSASAANIGNFPGKRAWVDGDRVKGCYFCFRQPLTSESSVRSPVHCCRPYRLLLCRILSSFAQFEHQPDLVAIMQNTILLCCISQKVHMRQSISMLNTACPCRKFDNRPT